MVVPSGLAARRSDAASNGSQQHQHWRAELTVWIVNTTVCVSLRLVLSSQFSLMRWRLEQLHDEPLSDTT